MDNKQIFEKYESESVKSIFGYMYGMPFIDIFKNGQLLHEKDRIIEIRKEHLELGANGTSFVYVWGMPGPDYNIYKFSDYGITWAFTPDEIKPAEKTEHGKDL